MRLLLGLFVVLAACVGVEAPVEYAEIVKAAIPGVCPGNPEAAYCLQFADQSIASVTLGSKGIGEFRSGDVLLDLTFSTSDTETVAQLCPNLDGKPFGTIRIPRTGGEARFRLDYLLGAVLTETLVVSATAYLPENIPGDITEPTRKGPNGKWMKNATTMIQQDSLFILYSEPMIMTALSAVQDTSTACERALWGRYDQRRRHVEFPPVDYSVIPEIATTSVEMQFSSDFTAAIVKVEKSGPGAESWEALLTR